MELNDTLNLRVSSELKRALDDRGITAEDIRELLEDQVVKKASIGELAVQEQERYREWVEVFEEYYNSLQQKLKNKDSLILAEIKRLESEWDKIQREVKSTTEKCDEIPEIGELSYSDIFDYTKLRGIVDKYWDPPTFRVGIVQIQRYICYKAVTDGNFKTLQASMNQFDKDKGALTKQYDDNLRNLLSSDEFKKESMLRQRLIKKEKEEGVKCRQ